ncbi:MAG: hypothetical protein U5K69_05995 [Balneolaceae bacterium]|nr:hypothetical protein [Balneolaceae bacterium]
MKSAVSSSINEIHNVIHEFEISIADQKQQINQRHNEQEAKFIELRKKFEKHSAYLNKYNQLTSRLEEKRLINSELEKLKEKLSKLSKSRDQIANEYSELKEKIFNLRLEIINELNEKFDNEIVIQLSFGGIKTKFEKLLRRGLKGSGIHYNVLVPEIATSLTPRKFAKAIHSDDLSVLRQIRNIDESRSATIADSFRESEELYEIEKLYLPDRPDFLLRPESVS